MKAGDDDMDVKAASERACRGDVTEASRSMATTDLAKRKIYMSQSSGGYAFVHGLGESAVGENVQTVRRLHSGQAGERLLKEPESQRRMCDAPTTLALVDEYDAPTPQEPCWPNDGGRPELDFDRALKLKSAALSPLRSRSHSPLLVISVSNSAPFVQLVCSSGAEFLGQCFYPQHAALISVRAPKV